MGNGNSETRDTTAITTTTGGTWSPRAQATDSELVKDADSLSIDVSMSDSPSSRSSPRVKPRKDKDQPGMKI